MVVELFTTLLLFFRSFVPYKHSILVILQSNATVLWLFLTNVHNFHLLCTYLWMIEMTPNGVKRFLTFVAKRNFMWNR